MSVVAGNGQKACPACGKPNSCARAADPEATHCWCREIRLPDELLTEIKDEFPDLSCLCKQCLISRLEAFQKRP